MKLCATRHCLLSGSISHPPPPQSSLGTRWSHTSHMSLGLQTGRAHTILQFGFKRNSVLLHLACSLRGKHRTTSLNSALCSCWFLISSALLVFLIYPLLRVCLVFSVTTNVIALCSCTWVPSLFCLLSAVLPARGFPAVTQPSFFLIRLLCVTSPEFCMKWILFQHSFAAQAPQLVPAISVHVFGIFQHHRASRGQ